MIQTRAARKKAAAPEAGHPFALARAVRQGDFPGFCRHLERARTRLLNRALRTLAEDDAEECVEAAMGTAFHRYFERPLTGTFDRWLDRLLEEAIRLRPATHQAPEEHWA